jgi:hypothetical protein
MPDQKLKTEAEDVVRCYNWAKGELCHMFERNMCELAILVLNAQYDAHEDVGFSDVAVYMALPDEDSDEEDNEYHRKMMMALIGWNILENDGIFL